MHPREERFPPQASTIPCIHYAQWTRVNPAYLIAFSAVVGLCSVSKAEEETRTASS